MIESGPSFRRFWTQADEGGDENDKNRKYIQTQTHKNTYGIFQAKACSISVDYN